MSITMKEIASICDVSRGTVDRVLNNRGKVRPETAERILAVAHSMGYRKQDAPIPAVSASSREYKIGVLINSLDHPYYAELLSGIIRALEDYSSYHFSGIIRQSASFDVDQQLLFLEQFLEMGVDALIISPANSRRIADKLTQFDAAGKPVVFASSINQYYTPFAAINSDHYSSGVIAAGMARLILPQGAKVSVLVGSLDMPGSALRLQGFCDILAAKRPDIKLLEPIQSFDDDVIAFKALSGQISRHQDIQLFFLAAGGYKGSFQALEDAGVLGKCRVLAFDTHDNNLGQLRAGNVCALFEQHPVQQGEKAVKVIVDYLAGHITPQDKQITIPIEIIIDESVETSSQHNSQINRVGEVK